MHTSGTFEWLPGTELPWRYSDYWHRSDDEIDVACRHHAPDHIAHALLAIDARKAVLVEKPVCLNAADARSVRCRQRPDTFADGSHVTRTNLRPQGPPDRQERLERYAVCNDPDSHCLRLTHRSTTRQRRWRFLDLGSPGQIFASLLLTAGRVRTAGTPPPPGRLSRCAVITGTQGAIQLIWVRYRRRSQQRPSPWQFQG